jgi:hypothetical protein
MGAQTAKSDAWASMQPSPPSNPCIDDLFPINQSINMAPVQNVPFAEYQRVFSAYSDEHAIEALIGLQRTYGPIRAHRLSPLVLVYLVHAPRLRDTALSLLARHAPAVRSLHMIVTSSCAITLLGTGDASNVAWALIDGPRLVCVHCTRDSVGEKALRGEGGEYSFSSALATAMAVSEALPQAATLLFASPSLALRCTTLNHLDPKFIRWARKHPTLGTHCPELPSVAAAPAAPAAVVVAPSVPGYARPLGDAPVLPARAPLASAAQIQIETKIIARQQQQQQQQQVAKQSTRLLRRDQQKSLRKSLQSSGLVIMPSRKPAMVVAKTRGSKRIIKSTLDRTDRKKAAKVVATDVLSQFLRDLDGTGLEDTIDRMLREKQERGSGEISSMSGRDTDDDNMDVLLHRNASDMKAEQRKRAEAAASLFPEDISEEELMRMHQAKVREVGPRIAALAKKQHHII